MRMHACAALLLQGSGPHAHHALQQRGRTSAWQRHRGPFAQPASRQHLLLCLSMASSWRVRACTQGALVSAMNLDPKELAAGAPSGATAAASGSGSGQRSRMAQVTHAGSSSGGGGGAAGALPFGEPSGLARLLLAAQKVGCRTRTWPWPSEGNVVVNARWVAASTLARRIFRPCVPPVVPMPCMHGAPAGRRTQGACAVVPACTNV